MCVVLSAGNTLGVQALSLYFVLELRLSCFFHEMSLGFLFCVVTSYYCSFTLHLSLYDHPRYYSPVTMSGSNSQKHFIVRPHLTIDATAAVTVAVADTVATPVALTVTDIVTATVTVSRAFV